MEAMRVPIMQDPLSHLKGLQTGKVGFSQKGTGARSVCRHGNNTEAVNLFLLLEINTAAIFWIYSLFSVSMSIFAQTYLKNKIF